MNKERVYIHEILVGDYIRHVVSNRYGYVISITIEEDNIIYVVIDFNNKDVFEVKGIVRLITTAGLDDLGIFGCDYLKVVKRSMTFNYSHLCKNYCNHLKTFPEACENYCPCRKIAGSTYFPSFRSGSVKFVGFFDTTSVNISDYGYTLIFNYLAKSLPKPDSKFRDLSVEGVLDILNNGDKYKLQDYLIYKTEATTTIYFHNFEIDRYIVNSKFIPIIINNEHPCDYCIYKDTVNCSDCRLNELKTYD